MYTIVLPTHNGHYWFNFAPNLEHGVFAQQFIGVAEKLTIEEIAQELGGG